MEILIFQGMTEQLFWAPHENAATKRNNSGTLRTMPESNLDW